MSRVSDAAFLARRALRTVRVVYGGQEARASFKQSGETYRNDPNGNQTLEEDSTLLFDTPLATELGLVARTDIDVYPVGNDAGTPVTYRISQIRDEQDGLYRRAVIKK